MDFETVVKNLYSWKKIWEGVLAFREEKVQRIQGVSSGHQAGGGIYVLTLYFCTKFTGSGAQIATVSATISEPHRARYTDALESFLAYYIVAG